MIYSTALSLLLGFELSYYLLIVQTGIAAHYNSDLITLFPMFVGGIIGTLASGANWRVVQNPIHKIFIALSLQFGLSFVYPNYTFFTLALLGLAVGMMAPLGIYLFKAKQQKELLFALGVAYSAGTFLFTFDVNERMAIAVSLSAVALASAFVLRKYQIALDAKESSYPFAAYIPLMLWIFLDSNLFETLSRHENIDIWSNYTFTIMLFHLLGLVGAYFIKVSNSKKHLFIALLFFGSYALSYLEASFMLSIIYPFTISYYNVVVFTILSKEINLSKLSFMMIFVGWIASGLGLAIALSKILH